MLNIFSGCSELKTIYSYIENPTDSTGSNFSNYTTATLYVPAGTKEKYQSTNGWKDFTNIVEMGSKYNLIYKVDGETYKTYEIEVGTTITPETVPTKEGYTFSGWSEIPETMPAEDVTVIGTFTKNTTSEPEPTPEPTGDNALTISNAEVYAGQQIVLPIDMVNTESITAFQFDLYLPEGVTIAKDADEEDLIELTSRAAKSHTIAFSQQPDGAIRMVCTSMSGATFKENEGTILNITLDVASTMAEGDYDIEIKNIELSSGTAYNPADVKATLKVKTYAPGDTDGNGKVTVNDAVLAINHILDSTNDSSDFVELAADLDGNGVVTVNDVVILINDYILGGSSQNSLDINIMQKVTEDADYLYIDDISMNAGETKEVEVFMNTSRTDIQGLQCDIYLPEGIEFVPEVDGEDIYYADKGDRAAKSHSVAASLQADGALRVVETSTTGSTFKSNDQSVFYFTIKAKADIVAGTKEIKLANMELSYGGDPINPADRTATITVGNPTGINEIGGDAENMMKVLKFIKDNKVVIEKNKNTYNTSGNVVK